MTSALLYWVKHNYSLRGFKYNLFSWSVTSIAASGFASGLIISSKYKRWVCAVGSGIISGLSNVINSIIRKRKISIVDLLIDIGFGLLWGYLGGAGVGNDFWRKNLFFRGGVFVYQGTKYYISKNLRLIKPVVKSFIKAFGKYIGTTTADWLQKFVRKKV